MLRLSTQYRYEDQAPSQAGQLPDCLEFFDDGDCDDYNNSSVSVQHLKLRTKDGSFGNVSFPSPNKISSNEADQVLEDSGSNRPGSRLRSFHGRAETIITSNALQSASL